MALAKDLWVSVFLHGRLTRMPRREHGPCGLIPSWGDNLSFDPASPQTVVAIGVRLQE